MCIWVITHLILGLLDPHWRLSGDLHWPYDHGHGRTTDCAASRGRPRQQRQQLAVGSLMRERSSALSERW